MKVGALVVKHSTVCRAQAQMKPTAQRRHFEKRGEQSRAAFHELIGALEARKPPANSQHSRGKPAVVVDYY
jgi:hypothetical protein